MVAGRMARVLPLFPMAPGLIAPFLSHRIRLVRWRAALGLGLVGLAAAGSLRAGPVTPAAPAAKASAGCLECHSDEKLTMKKAGRMVPLFVNQAAFARSVHRTLDCTDCHDGFDGDSVPHKKPLTAVDCGSCHEKEAKLYATSIHGMSHAMGASGAATCTSCHGAHEIVPVKQIDSPGVQAQPPADLRQMPQQQEPDRRVSASPTPTRPRNIATASMARPCCRWD